MCEQRGRYHAATSPARETSYCQWLTSFSAMISAAQIWISSWMGALKVVGWKLQFRWKLKGSCPLPSLFFSRRIFRGLRGSSGSPLRAMYVVDVGRLQARARKYSLRVRRKRRAQGGRVLVVGHVVAVARDALRVPRVVSRLFGPSNGRPRAVPPRSHVTHGGGGTVL